MLFSGYLPWRPPLLCLGWLASRGGAKEDKREGGILCFSQGIDLVAYRGAPLTLDSPTLFSRYCQTLAPQRGREGERGTSV
jgi:hypothetical protein